MCGKERKERQAPLWAGEEVCVTAEEDENNHLHRGEDKLVIKSRELDEPIPNLV